MEWLHNCNRTETSRFSRICLHNLPSLPSHILSIFPSFSDLQRDSDFNVTCDITNLLYPQNNTDRLRDTIQHSKQTDITWKMNYALFKSTFISNWAYIHSLTPFRPKGKGIIVKDSSVPCSWNLPSCSALQTTFLLPMSSCPPLKLPVMERCAFNSQCMTSSPTLFSLSLNILLHSEICHIILWT